MRKGGDKLSIAANGASIGVPDQKLSRLEAADEHLVRSGPDLKRRCSFPCPKYFRDRSYVLVFTLCIPNGAKLGREYQGALSPFRSSSNLFHLAHNSGVIRVCSATERDHPLELTLAFRLGFCQARIDSVKVQNRFSSDSITRVLTLTLISALICIDSTRARIGSCYMFLGILGFSESTRFVKNRFIRTRGGFHLFKSPSSYFSSILVSLKVLAMMSRRKTPAVKLKNVPSKDPLQLSQLPLRKWAATRRQASGVLGTTRPPRLKAATVRTRTRLKFPSVLSNTRYHMDCVRVPETGMYYPRMMAAIATTLRLHDGIYDSEGDGEFWLWFRLLGFKYTLDLNQFNSILGLRNSGVLFKEGSVVPKRLTSFNSETAAQRLRVSRITGKKYSVSAMKTDHRLLQYILSYIWLPRRGNHRVLTEEDLIILWAIVQKVTLNWPYLIAQHLVNCTTSCLNTGLGHGALLTKIFEHLGVDLSGEEAVLVDDKNAITTRHLNKMGRGPKVAAERNEEAGKGSSHPQNVGSSTPFQTSLSENVQGIHRRLDGCESHLSMQDKEIQEFGNDMGRYFSRAAQSEDQEHQDDAPGQE
ncbi:hypothetical protein PIB30_078281 [Stylosanthes scabra]|uniref:Uncharacterized protein n=1 Tax=Stylosanthes scabra TaxID=79078 RepID=A0ABU6YQ92_9FABA|nr:hypothetical protein [Stylosanthes scabra]